MHNYNFIIGSKSPRRQELFKAISTDFEIIVKEVEEVYPEFLQSFEIPQYLSDLKSNAYRELLKQSDDNKVVMTADTMVVLDNKVLGKPKSEEEAVEMLQSLSGKMHEVITGVTLMKNGKKLSFSESSKVYFNELTLSEIEYYVKNYQPLDKAGSYGIQEFIGMIGINKIDGCYYNIMGLPVNRIYNELKTF